MRAVIVLLAVAFALAAACQISKQNYQLIADGPLDTTNGGSDAAIDGPSTMPLGKLYFVSAGSATTDGIYLVAKDGSGNLSVPASIAQPVASGSNAPLTMLLGSDGHQLYSVEFHGGSNQLAHYTINADGTLVRLNDTLSLTNGGGRAALDPSGKWIVLAPGGIRLTIVTLDTMGKPLSAGSSGPELSTAMHDVAFARGGSCVLAVSSQSGGMTTLNRLYGYPFANGVLSATAGNDSANQTAARIAVHPNGSIAYVSDNASSNVVVQAYAVASGCAVSRMGSAITSTDTGAADLVVDPAGKYLFASSHAVTRITLTPAGDLTQAFTTYLPQPAGFFDASVAMDPAVPDRLYVVGSGYNDTAKLGAIAASIDGSGGLTEVSHAYPAPLGGQLPAIVLAP